MIESNRYETAFSEVYEILQYLEEDEYKKIPSVLIKTIKNNRNKKYLYNIEPGKKLKEQQMLPETKAILFNIFRDYLSTETQKETIKKWQLNDLEKAEEEKRLKYDVDVFKDNINSSNNLNTNGNMQLVKVEENTWRKILNKIKKIFHK